MRTWNLLLLLLTLSLSLVGLGGCETDGASDGASPGQGGPEQLAPADLDLPAPAASSGALPVWETAEERAGAKEDALDIRASYAEIYGVTPAPAGPVRGVAEFEPTDGVLVAWAGDLSPFFVDLTAALVDVAPVYLVTPNVEWSDALDEYLASAAIDTSGIRYLEYAHEAFWTRDYGPIPIELSDGAAAMVDPKYYYHRRRDDAVTTLLANYVDVPVYRPDLSTEGGNFMTNGAGLCVVTEWLLQENPDLSRTELAAIQQDYFGCEETIVLERMYGEGTGHVDMYAKFTAADTVLVGEYDPAEQPTNAAILDRNAAKLAAITLDDGRPLRVVRIPMPSVTGQVYRSYTNSLIVNDRVLMPTYDTDRHLEDAAVAAYREALPPGYDVVKVDSSEIIELGGAVHCTTMSFNVGRVSDTGPTIPEDDAPPIIEDDTPTVEDPTPTPPPAGERTFTAAPDAAIHDGSRTTDTITVTADGTVEAEVVVEVDIAHTYVGDLLVLFEHDGLYAELQRFQGGAAQSLQQRWRITGLAGAPIAGDWSLIVEDHANQDEGTLRSWSITFE